MTTYGAGTYGGATYGLVHSVIRERPPLRLDWQAIAPSGRSYHWSPDSPDAENVPQDGQFSSTMPGGFESMGCKLARKPGVDYSDLEELSTIIARGAGGDIAWEGRLERTPRASGDQIAITPAAVGWQTYLEDNKTARQIYVDIDLGRWTGAGVQRRLNLNALNRTPNDPSVTPDAATGEPALLIGFQGPLSATGLGDSEAWYDAGAGCAIGSLHYAWKKNDKVNDTDPAWFGTAYLTDDDLATTIIDAADVLTSAGPGSGALTGGATARHALVELWYDGASTADNDDYALYWKPAVFGDHGLTKRGGGTYTDAPGLYDSDIVAHILARHAPLLRTTRAGASTLEPTTLVVPQLAFLDPTTAAEMLRQANRFSLLDWAVWEDRTYWRYSRGGGPSRRWRARTGPAQLEETGPQVDRLWDSIMVQYTDVSGVTRTVGPPGSGADVEDPALADADTENPARLAGVTRRDLLAMGTSTPAAAIEVGRRFLEQSKLLDTSGRATLVGHILDDRGVIHPAWRVRAGDEVSFVDAADTEYRRITRADYSDPAKACSVDLDAPPEGLAALLERLSAVLVPLGISN